MAHVDFYYDIVCPYAYLGSTQIQAIADRCGASVSYKPILLGGVLQSVGSPTVPMNAMPPSKARHNLLDMQRWADLWKVPFKFPNGHPRRSVGLRRPSPAENLHPAACGVSEGKLAGLRVHRL